MIKFAFKALMSCAIAICINIEFSLGLQGGFAMGALAYIVVDTWLAITIERKP